MGRGQVEYGEKGVGKWEGVGGDLEGGRGMQVSRIYCESEYSILPRLSPLLHLLPSPHLPPPLSPHTPGHLLSLPHSRTPHRQRPDSTWYHSLLVSQQITESIIPFCMVLSTLSSNDHSSWGEHEPAQH